MVLSSVVERFLDTEKAAGSNPVAPIQQIRLTLPFRAVYPLYLEGEMRYT